MPYPDFPPLDDPLLRERLLADQETFLAGLRSMAAAVGPRVCGEAEIELALGYPWERGGGSFVLGDAADVDLAGRWPVLAYGSNAAPERLAVKFGHLTGEDASVLVEAGTLHDADVVAAAGVTAYGSVPATIAPAPGAVAAVAVLWCTPRQVAQLTWSEVSYRFGWLTGVRIDFERAVAPALPGGAVLAYLTRYGLLCPGGTGPLPLRLGNQEALLDAAAGVCGMPSSREVVRAVFADYGAFLAGPGARVWAAGRPAAFDGWLPFR